jgi:hypothetical protein
LRALISARDLLPHFPDQPREVSLAPLLQFIYWIVAVVDANLF